MFFSIIVPVYNVEKYLKQCIESIINQNFKDYELILVDDCSTDRSGKICDEYQNVTVIHKEKNEGLAQARNSGLECCSGEYVIFIDSDDFLLDRYALDKIANQIKDSNCDVLIFGYKKYFEDQNVYQSVMRDGIGNDLSIDELIRFNVYKALGWNKVVKVSLLQMCQMQFPKGIVGEDLIWCFELLLYASNIRFLKEELYAYRQREDSIVHVKDREKKQKHIEDVIYSINYCLQNINISGGNKYYLYSYLAYEYAWLLGTVYPFWNKYQGSVKRFEKLLEYRLSDKVKKVWLVYRLFGLRMTAYICCSYIQKKA